MSPAAVKALADKEIVSTLAAKLGADEYAATEPLWQTYHPWIINNLISTIKIPIPGRIGS
jgi:hypothetical protein